MLNSCSPLARNDSNLFEWPGNISCTWKFWQLPLRFELLWVRPQLGVTVQSIDWNHNTHVLGDCDSFDLDSFFCGSLQTWCWGVKPDDKTRIFFSVLFLLIRFTSNPIFTSVIPLRFYLVTFTWADICQHAKLIWQALSALAENQHVNIFLC